METFPQPQMKGNDPSAIATAIDTTSSVERLAQKVAAAAPAGGHDEVRSLLEVLAVKLTQLGDLTDAATIRFTPVLTGATPTPEQDVYPYETEVGEKLSAAIHRVDVITAQLGQLHDRARV